MEVLNDVYVETISMDDQVTKRAKAVVHGFVEDWFIETMKETDNNFNAIFQRISYVGSFYDGLRVGEATEFDLNVVFRLPFNIVGDFDLVKTNCEDAKFFGVKPVLLFCVQISNLKSWFLLIILGITISSFWRGFLVVSITLGYYLFLEVTSTC